MNESNESIEPLIRLGEGLYYFEAVGFNRDTKTCPACGDEIKAHFRSYPHKPVDTEFTVIEIMDCLNCEFVKEGKRIGRYQPQWDINRRIFADDECD